jgi:hypothetical protein
MITANGVICSKMMKSIMEVWLATKTCATHDKQVYVSDQQGVNKELNMSWT